MQCVAARTLPLHLLGAHTLTATWARQDVAIRAHVPQWEGAGSASMHDLLLRVALEHARMATHEFAFAGQVTPDG